MVLCACIHACKHVTGLLFGTNIAATCIIAIDSQIWYSTVLAWYFLVVPMTKFLLLLACTLATVKLFGCMSCDLHVNYVMIQDLGITIVYLITLGSKLSGCN